MPGVFFERAICSRKRHVETSRREEEMGRVKGGGEREEKIFFIPSPSSLSFFRPRTYRKGYYFYSPQSSTVIKSKMAATTILRTRTRFRPPKIRLHCRLFLRGQNRKQVWKRTLFGLKYGQDFGNRAAHPHQEFPGVPPTRDKSTTIFHFL